MQSTTTTAPSAGCHLITKINVTGEVDQGNQVRCLVDVNIIDNGLCVGLSGRITKLMSILLNGSGKSGQALLCYIIQKTKSELALLLSWNDGGKKKWGGPSQPKAAPNAHHQIQISTTQQGDHH